MKLPREVNARRAVAEKIWERLRLVPVERSKRQHAAQNQRHVSENVPPTPKKKPRQRPLSRRLLNVKYGSA